MPRQKRIAKGNIVYHALNRANGRLRIFKKRSDFEAFEQILSVVNKIKRICENNVIPVKVTGGRGNIVSSAEVRS